MPSTRISTRQGWIAGRHREVIEAVQQALSKGLLIPEHDRCIFLQEFDDHLLITPPTKGSRYMVIEITLFSGRSMDAKRRLYRAISEELAQFEVPAADIKTILIEVDQENWGLSGQPASEMDLGFKIDV
ncbi:tautomerase family protein [Methylobacterium sp. 17Sr1-1]|uniref:tautomerase family protein n=1 Tax=Methylobacterium sp. 17Sr1-1 TaxID=2202826 RepID=UPI000D6EB41E|nr:tautomerase family protein [Methylobacterium sp. 17Sr1-1]AWN52320.1 4-oxalocrotonate tautomerase [Methylobacterium sp. 17Sr1-1]